MQTYLIWTILKTLHNHFRSQLILILSLHLFSLHPVTAHQKYVELPENFETVYTATNGSTATLQCPTPPGQLRQHYSVQWKKGFTVVAQLISSSIEHNTAPRHSIDKTDYSLIIEDVQVNDANTNYKCEVFVTDPLSFQRIT